MRFVPRVSSYIFVSLSNRGDIVEAFAAYFEPNNMPVCKTKEVLKRKLSEGKMSSLVEVLLSEGSSEELVILIDFLLKKDVAKFKKFYVHVTRAQKEADMQKAVQKIYGTNLKDMEEQWYRFIKEPDI